MQTLCRLLAIALVMMMTAVTAFADTATPTAIYGKKLFGIVVEMPKGGIGAWKISGKRVEVAKETTIDEQIGKAEVGAFVEVTGKKQGSIFRAYKIEVKLPKKPTN